MGSVQRIRNVEFEARGLKYQQLAGDNEIAAWSLLETIEAKIRQGQINGVDCHITVAAFWLNFNNFALGVYPTATTLRLEKAVGHFSNFLNGTLINIWKLRPGSGISTFL